MAIGDALMTRRDVLTAAGGAVIVPVLAACDATPREDVWPEVRMPQVAVVPDLDVLFEQARELSSGESGGDSRGRYVTIVTPQRRYVGIPCPIEGTMGNQDVAAMEELFPRVPRKNVVVIAFTEIPASGDRIAQANTLIPFLGLLIGIAYIGHIVWVFEGHPSALYAGCRHADVLIVDSAMIPFLQPDWMTVALTALKSPAVYKHDRAGYALRRLK